MVESIKPDLCIIGAGAGGLAVAAGAAQLGAEVVLVERDKIGGQGMYFGSMPSKALLAAAKCAQTMRDAKKFGIEAVEPKIDHQAVLAHVQEVIAAVAANETVERYAGLGIRTILAEGKFQDRRTLIAGDVEIRARRFVIATGSSPAIPQIPGLDSTPFLTTDTIFGIEDTPRHLIIIGGGPIGLEMAQAHRRLGSEVTIIEALTPLSLDDEELRRPVIKSLTDEGVRILDHARLERVETTESEIRVVFIKDNQAYSLDGTHLLLAAGRRPNVDNLNLEAAHIKYDRNGIMVNSGLKTSNRRVYAIGDAAGGPHFAHIAKYHASVVVKNALFRLPGKVNHSNIPWVTFTDPELAHVGLTEEGARKKHGAKINVMRWPYLENDRARAERATDGYLKVITNRAGGILGASMVGANAGEIIQMWSLAMQKEISIKMMATYTAPYPTFAEINQRAAIAFYLPKLANPLLKHIVGWLKKLG
jgi:pyruvate/2-oxoglutarate dehydrogenase complex dihydrolipoamide dehydrogenase (E3) component